MSHQDAFDEIELSRTHGTTDTGFPDEMGPSSTEQMTHEQQLSALERTLSTNSPILASLLLQLPTPAIFHLYHTSSFLSRLLQTCPIAWKHLSFRLAAPSAHTANANASVDGIGSPRPSVNYALDRLLLRLVNPFSRNLKSLELDNTAVSGQILTSTVMLLRRETLEHLSVRGCKNVSLKYHINPHLNVFGLQYKAANEPGTGKGMPKMALKSLYTYRCRHHRRRPYLPSSLSRRDSDSEPTHELVTLCWKLGIWTDTAWCTTPGNRCYRRRNYVQMRVPNGAPPEVWVVFDRLWRSRNWIGPPEGFQSSGSRDGRSWEQDEYAAEGEPLGMNFHQRYREGKATPSHLRASHREFVEDITCDGCGEPILERCEQCSVLMHCVGCRRTLCASCAYDRPYNFRRHPDDPSPSETIWWAPGYGVSPCIIAESPPAGMPPNTLVTLPSLTFKWCCTQPIFSGGGGMSFAPNVVREAERVRAAPLPRGKGWDDLEFSQSSTNLEHRVHLPKVPNVLPESDRAQYVDSLIGPPGRAPIDCPRNLCGECYESETWKVYCKTCSKPLCKEHDLRGLKLRICGLKDLSLEKVAVREQAAKEASARAALMRSHQSPDVHVALPTQLEPQARLSSPVHHIESDEASSAVEAIDDVSTQTTTTAEAALHVPLHHPLPSRPLLPLLSSSASSLNDRPPSAGSLQTITSRGSSPVSVSHETSQPACATPIPSLPTWTGCLSFFCPSFRTHGDMRPRCPSINSTLKECASCSTFVCIDCVNSSPIPISLTGCKCSSCQNTFFCPNCMGKRIEIGECKRVEEEKREKEERERRERLAEDDRRGKEKSDWVLGMAGEFWGTMEGNNWGGNSGIESVIEREEEEVDVPEILRRHVPRLRDESIASISAAIRAPTATTTATTNPTALFQSPPNPGHEFQSELEL